MPNGAPPGKGQPFYFYPFYSYVLAAVHWLISDDFASVMFFNAVALASLAYLFWLLGWRDRRAGAILVGVMGLGAFTEHLLRPYAWNAYTDNLYICMVFLTLVACAEALRRNSATLLLLAGIASALTAATRPSFMTFAPLFVAAAVMGFGGHTARDRIRIALLVLGGFAIGLAPFAVRNYIMAGKLEVLVSSWIQLPYFLVPPEIVPNPITHPPGSLMTLTQAVALVWQMVQADPVGVVTIELRKLAFTLGVTQLGMPGGVTAHYELITLSLLFAFTMWRRRLPRPLAFVIGTFAVSHGVAMLMAAPWTYGHKSIMPLHAAFLFTAAYLLPGNRPDFAARASGPAMPAPR